MTNSKYFAGPPSYLIDMLQLRKITLASKHLPRVLGELVLMVDKHDGQQAVVEVRYPNTVREHVIVSRCAELAA